MAGRRFLLMHVTTSSGHHHASRAIAQALRRIDSSCQVINVDAFDYTSRFVRWAIMRSYMSMIRHHPDLWEYLYDNPAVGQHVQNIRPLLHRYHAKKLARLLETVQPDAIACTQAFPCGMVADFKQRHELPTPLVGVLTDYAPHLYWMHDSVDAYVVPADEVKQRLVSYGIEPSRVRASGIPIEPRFLDPVDRDAVCARFKLNAQEPIVLVMGGGGGFGPIQELMRALDRVPHRCQVVVLAGTNRALAAWLRRQSFRHPVTVEGYSDDVPQLMAVARVIISKPGGLTTAEALAKRVPLLILQPIPGQEQCNARYLLSHGAAIELKSPHDVERTLTTLLRDAGRLEELRRNTERIGHPDSALKAAELLIELANRRERRVRKRAVAVA